MKIRSALALAGLAIGFVFPTFAGQKDAIDPKIDQQIRALASKLDEANNKNDPRKRLPNSWGRHGLEPL